MKFIFQLTAELIDYVSYSAPVQELNIETQIENRLNWETNKKNRSGRLGDHNVYKLSACCAAVYNI